MSMRLNKMSTVFLTVLIFYSSLAFFGFLLLAFAIL